MILIENRELNSITLLTITGSNYEVIDVLKLPIPIGLIIDGTERVVHAVLVEKNSLINELLLICRSGTATENMRNLRSWLLDDNLDYSENIYWLLDTEDGLQWRAGNIKLKASFNAELVATSKPIGMDMYSRSDSALMVINILKALYDTTVLSDDLIFKVVNTMFNKSWLGGSYTGINLRKISDAGITTDEYALLTSAFKGEK